MYLGSNRSGALLALAIGTLLSGCGNSDVDTHLTARKPDLFGTKNGYTFSELQESRQVRPITANDLVDANGGCAAPPLPAQPQAPPPQAAAGAAPPDNPGAGAPVGADAGSLLGGGIALGMSECDVVYRAGQPTSVQLGNAPSGGRAATLTFNSGPRAGIYRFEGGRLMEMDRTAAPPPPPEAVKKKPVKRKPGKKNDQA